MVVGGGQNEVIKPTIDGVLNVLRSCERAGTVKRVVYTSSAGSVNVVEHPKSQYDETDWSDFDFIRRVKMTGWVCFPVPGRFPPALSPQGRGVLG